MYRASAFSLILLTFTPAWAVDIGIFDPDPDQGAFRGVSEDLGAAFSYKTLNPTEPLGVTGFNVGVVASYTSLDNDGAFEDLIGESVNDLATVGVGAIKGLPLGFDIGAFYTEGPDSNVRLYGGEVRYAFVPGGTAAPALGVRVAGTKLDGIDRFDMETLSVDVSASKGFAFVTPYAGLGQVFVFSDPDSSIALEDEDFSDTRVFAGARLSVLPFQVIGEVDNVGGATSFNLRLAFAL